MYAGLLAIIAPVLVMAGIGWGWARLGRAYDTRFLTELVTTLGVPALVLHTLVNADIGGEDFGLMAGATALAIALFGAIGYGVLKLTRLSVHAFLPPLMFANMGNMGLPLSFYAFGEAGLGLAIACFMVTSVANFTIGPWLFSGGGGLRRLVRMPLIYAVIVALAIKTSAIVLPLWLMNAIELLSRFTIPLMLLTLGVSIARLDVVRPSRTLALALLRLGMGAAVGLGIALAIGLEGAARGVLIIECGMPVAVFNYLFAQRYEREPAEVASLVVASTVVSFATLPLLLLVALP